MDSQYLILLQCGNFRYAIEADHVVEVMRIEYLQKIPGCRRNLAGVMVRRNTLVPVYVIDQEYAGSDKLFYAIILYKRERYIGLACEEVGITVTEKANPVDDKKLIKHYNKHDIMQQCYEIQDKIYSLLEYKEIDRIYYENNKGGLNESEDTNCG
jgi:chemotaxis signal transduction protein